MLCPAPERARGHESDHLSQSQTVHRAARRLKSLRAVLFSVLSSRFSVLSEATNTLTERFGGFSGAQNREQLSLRANRIQDRLINCISGPVGANNGGRIRLSDSAGARAHLRKRIL